MSISNFENNIDQWQHELMKLNAHYKRKLSRDITEYVKIVNGKIEFALDCPEVLQIKIEHAYNQTLRLKNKKASG